MLTASGEESQKVPFLNTVVKVLRAQLSTVRTKVMGTDESQIKIRGQTKGMNVMKGPPLLWITINPLDTGDPIAQVLAGEEINLDKFDNSLGLNSAGHTTNIATDPYVVAKFFHLVVATILEELFGIKAYSMDSHDVKWTDGICGKVASYIGTQEVQGCGTLHLHIVMWLMDTLTHIQMKQALKSHRFRNKVKSFICANIWADLDGLDHNMILKMAHQNAVSYLCLVDPHNPDYSNAAQEAETKLARAVQHHVCSKDLCLVAGKRGIQCKR